MRAPTGSVVGLCSASATMSAIGMAFLGYWGVHEPVPWRAGDIVVVCLMFLGFLALGATILIITSPTDDGSERIVPARRAFAAGWLLLWAAVIVAIIR